MKNTKTYLTELPKQEFLAGIWTHVSSGSYAIYQKNAEEKFQIIFNGTSQKFYQEIRDLKFSENESEPYDGVYSAIEFSKKSNQASYMAVQNNALYLIEHQL